MTGLRSIRRRLADGELMEAQLGHSKDFSCGARTEMV